MWHIFLEIEPNTITYKSSLTPKKLYKKTNAIFSIYEKTGLSHDIFFEFSLRPFEVVEAKGGRLVKEANFEAEIFFLLKQKN